MSNTTEQQTNNETIEENQNQGFLKVFFLGLQEEEKNNDLSFFASLLLLASGLALFLLWFRDDLGKNENFILRLIRTAKKIKELTKEEKKEG
jgi:hypothetical protein